MQTLLRISYNDKTIIFLIEWYFVWIFWINTRISCVLEISLKCFEYIIVDPICIYFDKNATKIEDKFIWWILVWNGRSKPVSTPRTWFVRNLHAYVCMCREAHERPLMVTHPLQGGVEDHGRSYKAFHSSDRWPCKVIPYCSPTVLSSCASKSISTQRLLNLFYSCS